MRQPRRTAFTRPDTQQRDETLILKLSKDEKGFIRAQAEQNNMTMSEMTRLVWYNWECSIRHPRFAGVAAYYDNKWK
jgi:hypothetical protein